MKNLTKQIRYLHLSEDSYLDEPSQSSGECAWHNNNEFKMRLRGSILLTDVTLTATDGSTYNANNRATIGEYIVFGFGRFEEVSNYDSHSSDSYFDNTSYEFVNLEKQEYLVTITEYIENRQVRVLI